MPSPSIKPVLEGLPYGDAFADRVIEKLELGNSRPVLHTREDGVLVYTGGFARQGGRTRWVEVDGGEALTTADEARRALAIPTP